jgi:hypothetical protein
MNLWLMNLWKIEQKDVKTSALASASGSAAPVLTPQASKAQTQPQAQPHAKAQLDPMEVIMAQTLRGNDTNKANEIAAANAKQKYEFLAVK